METVTLPSRLRPYHDFESSLAGEDGSHRVFELQSSILTNGENARAEATEDDTSQVETKFDVDFTYDNNDSKTAKIYNQVQVTRGADPEQQNRNESTYSSVEDRDIGFRRKQRLYSSEPMLQR